MLRSRSKLAIYLALLSSSSCSTAGETDTAIWDADTFAVAVPSQFPADKVGTAFEIEDSADPGAFNAYLRNDDDLFDPELFSRFKDLLQAYCEGEFSLLHDYVIITADQRNPHPYMSGSFRCGAATP